MSVQERLDRKAAHMTVTNEKRKETTARNKNEKRKETPDPPHTLNTGPYPSLSNQRMRLLRVAQEVTVDPA